VVTGEHVRHRSHEEPPEPPGRVSGPGDDYSIYVSGARPAPVGISEPERVAPVPDGDAVGGSVGIAPRQLQPATVVPKGEGGGAGVGRRAPDRHPPAAQRFLIDAEERVAPSAVA